MKFFKYLFFLVVLIFVVGSLYVATISIPNEKSLSFESPLEPQLLKQKIEDLSTYDTWFSFPEKATSEFRLGNAEDLKNTTLSWRNKNFENINFLNKRISEDSIVQQLKLKTWLSSSEFQLVWKFNSPEEEPHMKVLISTEAGFWQKAEYTIKGISHLESVETAIKESFEVLEQQLTEEVAVYDISMIGKIDTGGFYTIHATSAAKLNFESILKKSKPFFESIEAFMKEQAFETYKGRIIVFENLYEKQDNIIFSSGWSTENRIAIPDYFEVLTQEIPRSMYFKTQLKGDHSNLKELLARSESYLETRELEIDKSVKPFLEFEVDNIQSINPADWITNFYIPIQDEN